MGSKIFEDSGKRRKRMGKQFLAIQSQKLNYELMLRENE
jgi:hypothetical protein